MYRNGSADYEKRLEQARESLGTWLQTRIELYKEKIINHFPGRPVEDIVSWSEG